MVAGRRTESVAVLKMTSTLLISRKRRMPFGDDVSNAMHWPLLDTNSTRNLRRGVVTAGLSDQASRQASIGGKWLPYNHWNSILQPGGWPSHITAQEPAQGECRGTTGSRVQHAYSPGAHVSGILVMQ